jgi:hypothetical protein
MSTLFPKIISIEVESGGDYDNTTGKWVPGVITTTTFTGSVQPMTGKEVKSYEYLRQNIGHVKIYSSSKLNLSVKGGDTPGDIVLWLGKKYEVVKELEYQNDLINHYKYIAAVRDEE